MATFFTPASGEVGLGLCLPVAELGGGGPRGPHLDHAGVDDLPWQRPDFPAVGAGLGSREGDIIIAFEAKKDWRHGWSKSL